jgi:DNA-binding LacI/PurR family transcriptional regulator
VAKQAGRAGYCRRGGCAGNAARRLVGGERLQAGLHLARQRDWRPRSFTNDQLALAVLRALQEHDIKGPADISVVCFDDIDEAPSFIPPLTTVHRDFAEVGRRCVCTGLDQIECGLTDAPPATTLVPTRLVVRANTAAPPQRRRGTVRT